MSGLRAYRTTLWLCGLVVAGWLWDFSLGGGATHSLGWALGLILIGGISALADRSRSHRVAPPENEPVPVTEPRSEPALGRCYPIRPARPDEYPELIEVEIAADRLFPLAGYGETPPPASAGELVEAAAVFVLGDPAEGYARMEVVDGQAHLEGLSVRPKFMKQGRGRALVEAALEWARAEGYQQVTLCTFADVPWNGPFYRKLGFVELSELTPGLARLRATERRLGLDDMGRRVVLVHSLDTLER